MLLWGKKGLGKFRVGRESRKKKKIKTEEGNDERQPPGWSGGKKKERVEKKKSGTGNVKGGETSDDIWGIGCALGKEQKCGLVQKIRKKSGRGKKRGKHTRTELGTRGMEQGVTILGAWKKQKTKRGKISMGEESRPQTQQEGDAKRGEKETNGGGKKARDRRPEKRKKAP